MEGIARCLRGYREAADSRYVRLARKDGGLGLMIIQRPMNIKPRNRRERRALARLWQSQSIRRIANAQSGERGRSASV